MENRPLLQKNIFRPGGLDLTKKYSDIIGLGNDSRVLDIGCGPGATLALLHEEYGCEVYGIDISEVAVNTARRTVAGADIRVADASSLPYDDNSFDAAFMECTLSLFDDPKRALKEAYRVLNPGGVLVISVLTHTAADADPASLNASDFIINGAALPDRLISFLKETGFSNVSYTDEKHALTQLYVDIIFEYGSIAEYLKDAECRIGGSVFNCSMDRKHIGYGVFICRQE